MTAHFTADCTAGSLVEAPVRIAFEDTVQQVRFTAYTEAAICDIYDGGYNGFNRLISGSYSVTAEQLDDVEGRLIAARMTKNADRVYSDGSFELEIVDTGDAGYSTYDYVCLRMTDGPLRDYVLPARADMDDDGRYDEGCAYIGSGRLQINFAGTAPVMQVWQ